MKFEVQLHAGGGKKKRVVELEREGGGYRVLLDGKRVDANAVQIAPNTISILLNGQSFEIHVAPEPGLASGYRRRVALRLRGFL